MTRPAEAFARACAVAAAGGDGDPDAGMGHAGAESGRHGRLRRADIEAEARAMCRRDGHDPDIVLAINRHSGTGPEATP